MTGKYPGTKALDDLFNEYLNCGGDWLTSTVCKEVKNQAAKEVLGEEVYTKLCDLRIQVGDAEEIYESKKKLQAELPEDSEEAPYILKHPDLPGCEAGAPQFAKYKHFISKSTEVP